MSASISDICDTIKELNICSTELPYNWNFCRMGFYLIFVTIYFIDYFTVSIFQALSKNSGWVGWGRISKVLSIAEVGDESCSFLMPQHCNLLQKILWFSINYRRIFSIMLLGKILMGKTCLYLLRSSWPSFFLFSKMMSSEGALLWESLFQKDRKYDLIR